jgi:hypothetical protein
MWKSMSVRNWLREEGEEKTQNKWTIKVAQKV